MNPADGGTTVIWLGKVMKGSLQFKAYFHVSKQNSRNEVCRRRTCKSFSFREHMEARLNYVVELIKE